MLMTNKNMKLNYGIKKELIQNYRYKDADEEKWKENFSNPMRSGRVPGETLDFFIICPLAEKEKEKAWERSKLEDVKAYILEQM